MHRDFEYTIIDAGSEDGSVEIAETAAKDDPRINVVHRPGEPLYESILWGLDQARGDFLSWINADDLYTPWSLSAVSQHLSGENDAQWVSGLPGCWDADGQLCYVRPEGWRPRSLIKAGWFHKDLLGFIQQESIFFSRSLYASLTEEEKRGHCLLQTRRRFCPVEGVLRPGLHCKTVPTVLGGFRRHDNNQSVLSMDRYMSEVRSAGALFLPFPLRNFAQHCYRTASAAAAAKLTVNADARVNAAPKGN